MMSRKTGAAAALLTMSTAAFAADTVYEFDTVTNLKSDGTVVTGVLVNDTVPTTLTLTSSAGGQCWDWLQLLLKRPGKFTLTTTVTSTTGGPPSFTLISSCILNTKP
ncbi:hypothetical protein [Peristeroidobacter soli]|uniref:hypothetical protein n=1 Tax=Peristeroidobacter soli TaxID=2497877 RepID=UPI00101D5EF3|nr:hypothetical protein [Peristeroidobacter soli]